MDYVAYIAQEFGYNGEHSAHSNGNDGNASSSSLISVLLVRNFVSNHLLNVACTVGDSGALGAILWGFESRELDLEHAELCTGARLHTNLGSTGALSSRSWVRITLSSSFSEKWLTLQFMSLSEFT